MRLLIIDDDLELSRMLSEYLGAEGFETEIAGDGEAGVKAAGDGRFDAIVLDVMMPRMDGIEALRRIRRSSDVPIVMLTARGDNLDRVVGLEMGADDYIAKPYYPLELVARIRAVLRRRPEIAPASGSAAVSLHNLELRPQQRRATCNGEPLELTLSEFNVLEAIMRAGGDVIGKDDLSQRALGKPREAYDRSLDVHISNIRQKLSANGSCGAQIETVRGIGYRLVPA